MSLVKAKNTIRHLKLLIYKIRELVLLVAIYATCKLSSLFVYLHHKWCDYLWKKYENRN